MSATRPLFIVNAFESGPFTGNPAAVVPLEDWPQDDWLQAVAAQNNLSETAFFVEQETLQLRWFTPTTEIDLCGHATLATAHVIFNELADNRERLVFESASGELSVCREDDCFRLDFPAIETRSVEPDSKLGLAANEAAGTATAVIRSAEDLVLLVLDEQQQVAELAPNMAAVAALPGGTLIVTAPGSSDHDVVVRVFAPGVGIDEDPATGMAHCALAPYWCERLGTQELTSFQASGRGGYFRCVWRPDEGRVDLIGSCRTFARGELSG